MQNLGTATTLVQTSPTTTGVEAPAALLGPIIPNKEVQPILLLGSIQFGGAALTSYILRIRRSSDLTGAIVSGGIPITTGFSGTNFWLSEIKGVDVVLNTGPLFYVLTYTPTGATLGLNSVQFAALLL